MLLNNNIFLIRPFFRWLLVFGYTFVIVLQGLFAQTIPEKGVPWIDNYTPQQFKKHGKIWDIASANSGVVYMAGNGGLLEYDGQTWSQYEGSKGCTRSILVINDSLIYSGSDLDFGVWEKNKFNQFVYKSLYPFGKDPNEENEEFWDVYRISDYVIFVSFTNIYVYRNNQLTKIAAPTRFSGSFQHKEKVYLADEQKGLYEFNGRALKLLFEYPGSQPFQIAGLFENSSGLVIVTRDNGLFVYDSEKVLPLNNRASYYLEEDQVFCSTRINDNYFAFGTILNGLYIADKNGNVIQHINKKKGLLNNTILSIHFAANGMLWLGMDYGIAAIHLYSGVTYFFDYQGDYGSGQTALFYDNQFYLGTNQGLYKANWKELNNSVNSKPFTLIQGSEGQVWSLGNINGTILCGHDKGLFVVSGNSLKRVSSDPGVWTFLQYKEKYLLTGNYNGVSVFKLENGNYSFVKKIDLILGSCNQILIEKDNILWVNIPNFGLIRFSLNNDFYPEDRTIFPVSQFAGKAPFLLKEGKSVVLLTDEYRYTFDSGKEKFVQQSDNALPKNITGLLEGAYLPTPLDENFEFYPIYNGFAFHNASIEAQVKPKSFPLLMRKTEAFNNHAKQLIFSDATISYALNNLNINFIVPNKDDVLYQYRLYDYTKQWSNWTTNTSVDFLNLREGNYTFSVRAKYGSDITKSVEFPFSISPPWYRTKLAYLCYLIGTVLLYFLIREWQNFRLRNQKKALLKKEQYSLHRLAEKHKQQTLLAQQQQLENEKDFLKQQVKQKSIELAKQARDSENKNRILQLLNEKINELQHDPAIGKMRWAEIKRLLDLYLETEDKTFEIQIDDLHQEFFQKLRDQYPDLSLYDLRLCAYLKIGLNSKEISEILKVLPSSINVSRSRLRKKLNLSQDEDLYSFLNQIR